MFTLLIKWVRKVVYLKLQLCLRETEGRSKAQLLIMDVCPRYQRPKLRSQTGMLAPITSPHRTQKLSLFYLVVVFKYDIRNGKSTLCNRSPFTRALLILPYFICPPVCIFHWWLRSYIHDRMKISMSVKLAKRPMKSEAVCMSLLSLCASSDPFCDGLC